MKKTCSGCGQCGAQGKPCPDPLAGDPRLFIETLGYDVDKDSDQLGLWVWTAGHDGCDVSLATAAQALDGAWNDAVARTLKSSGISVATWADMTFDQQQAAMTEALSIGGISNFGTSPLELPVIPL